ncbi:tRNA glutamyl-Q(34) synthetase GluQRS [Alsobacter sp. SYSU M60028]|uniref:tRNA glutamyl-Q(34) synthetase GluQRS n=1 Tax=Alsobacter ponti TaxID=2962936 RepID=A0ABT1LJ12_9HYPH|nr:tRNA glutamyl-Q(34) synthetase GluQRS [Alsobacter ponti]
MPQPVFRFAPSPNGWLHLGHAASALLNAELARRMGGRFLLRIEDIDAQRSRPEFEAGVYEDLAWLGLSWEKPVLRQSEHMARYAAALETLKARGLLYPCFCTRAQAARFAAEKGADWPRDPDGAPLHAGPCRALPAAERARRIADGEPHAWRLAMDAALADAPGPLTWTDWNPDTGATRLVEARPVAWGDAVLGRKDAPTSYHLAVVLDDALQGVTHVVRGADLEAATDLHRLLQALFGLPTPVYHHHPLLLDADGRKLAKSLDSTPLRQLRAEGVTPEEARARIGWFSVRPGSSARPSS